jgi:hypothetical protein
MNSRFNGENDMTVSHHRQRQVSIAALGVFLMGAVCADHALAQNIRLTLNANVQLTKLHPDVKAAAVTCTAPLANGQSRTDTTSGLAGQVNNRAFNQTLQALITFYPADFADPANRTLNVTCRLQLAKFNSGPYYNAQPNAAEPTAISPANWLLVAAGSTVTWTQSVTFPNTAP